MFEIYNLQGALMLRETLAGGKAEVNIGYFSKGVYILKVTGKEGKEFREKVIIR